MLSKMDDQLSFPGTERLENEHILRSVSFGLFPSPNAILMIAAVDHASSHCKQ